MCKKEREGNIITFFILEQCYALSGRRRGKEKEGQLAISSVLKPRHERRRPQKGRTRKLQCLLRHLPSLEAGTASEAKKESFAILKKGLKRICLQRMRT